ncbi:MAG TPA: hypothetical protein VF230_05275 [Acidimicrobiales bacterium]
MQPIDDRPVSALPSPLARALAFTAIVLAGLCGALIGWSFVDLQCAGDCTTPTGIGAVVGGVVSAAGVAVVAVLTLRAMGEWKRIREAELFGEEAPPHQPPMIRE